MSSTSYRPAGFHDLTPYLTVEGADRFIAFLKAAFRAEEVFLEHRPDGTVGNAQLRIGDAMVEVSEARDAWQATTCALHLYVPNVDAVYARAVAAGATSLMPPTDQPYGDRDSALRDAFGNHWYIATHTADVAVAG